ELSGDWEASKPAISKVEPALGNAKVDFYEDEVTWTHKLTVPAGAAPGKNVLRCQLQFQICNESSCKNPARVTAPDVGLTILGAGASSPASVQRSVAAKPEATPPPTAKPTEPAPAAAPVAVAAPSAPAAPDGLSDVARKAEQGIIPFMIFS